VLIDNLLGYVIIDPANCTVLLIYTRREVRFGRMVVWSAKRNLRQQSSVQCLSKPSSASPAKNIVLLAAGRTFVISHILDYAQHFVVRLQCHRSSTGGYKGSRRMRSRHDDFAAMRNHLMYI